AVEKMVELWSGCICCTIDDYRFDLAVQEIVETTRPHLIIIESTGLADPEPLVDRVKAAGLGLDAIITVVDALDGPRHLRETRVARLQIEAADFLVLNKVDLIDSGAARPVDRRGAAAGQAASGPPAGRPRVTCASLRASLRLPTGRAERTRVTRGGISAATGSRASSIARRAASIRTGSSVWSHASRVTSCGPRASCASPDVTGSASSASPAAGPS